MGLGLRESKDITDNIFTLPYKFVSINIINDDDLPHFQKKLRDINWSDNNENYILQGDLAWLRNYKFLQLGIAQKEEYSDFIIDSIKLDLYNNHEVLKDIIEKLSKDDLVEIIKKYKI